MGWIETSARWWGPSGHGYADVNLWNDGSWYTETAWKIRVGSDISMYNAYLYGVASRFEWAASASQGGGHSHTATGYRSSAGSSNTDLAWTGYWELTFARLGSSYSQTLRAAGWGETVQGYGPYHGSATASKTWTIAAIERPAGATALTSSGNASAVHGLSWKASADGRTQGYHVYEVKDGGARTLVRTTTGLSASFKARTPGSVYAYEVAAYNARGDSANRPSAAIVGPVIVPTRSLVSYVPPSRITLKLGNNNKFPINIELRRAANDGAFSAIAVVKNVAAGGKVEHVDKAAPAGYASYKVRAVSPAASAFGDVLRLRTITAPLAVGFAGSDLDLKKTSELTVTWEPKPTVEKPVSYVKGGWSYDGGATWNDSVHAEAKGAHVAVTAIPAGGRARLRIRAVNDAGAGPWSQTPDFYGFALPPVWQGASLASQNGRPMKFSATAAVGDLGNRGYAVVMRCSLTGAGGEEYAAQPVSASSGTSRAYLFPYFDAGRRLAVGDYRLIAWLEKTDGTRVSDVAKSAPLRRDEIVPAEGPPAVDAAGNALVFAPATPYACDRLAEVTVYAYNTLEEPIELSVSARKTEAGASLHVPLGDYMAKVPYMLGTWKLAGLYDDGSAAYTIEGSFEEKKGPVFEVGGKVMRSHVIEPDGTVTEVFPFAIERTGR